LPTARSPYFPGGDVISMSPTVSGSPVLQRNSRWLAGTGACPTGASCGRQVRSRVPHDCADSRNPSASGRLRGRPDPSVPSKARHRPPSGARDSGRRSAHSVGWARRGRDICSRHVGIGNGTKTDVRGARVDVVRWLPVRRSSAQQMQPVRSTARRISDSVTCSNRPIVNGCDRFHLTQLALGNW
jgi:hypothetical protein